jgi:O-antigen/teichoic acid export membrane protein
MWPAYRDAVAAKDIAWLKTRHRQVTQLSILIVGAAGGTLALFGRDLVTLWGGPSAAPTQSLVLSLAMMLVIQGSLLPVGRLLTSVGGVRQNSRVAALNAVINLPISIVLGYRYGAAGVAAGTSIGYLSVGWLLFVSARRHLRMLEEEISDSGPK